MAAMFSKSGNGCVKNIVKSQEGEVAFFQPHLPIAVLAAVFLDLEFKNVTFSVSGDVLKYLVTQGLTVLRIRPKSFLKV